MISSDQLQIERPTETDDKRGQWNLGTPTNRVYIARQLRRGRTPQSMGAKEIGAGIQKAAYSIPGTDFVIKERQLGIRAADTRPPKGIKKYGAKFCKTEKCGNWCIQHMVTPIFRLTAKQRGEYSEAITRHRKLESSRDKDGNHLADLHGGNVGIDTSVPATTRTTLWVFDW